MNRNISSGITGLDFILFGGYPLHSSILLEGAPGTGKTTLGIQFLLNGAKNNQPGIYLTFEEFPDQIQQDMSQLGWDLKQYEKDGLMRIMGMTPEIIVKDMLNPDGIFETLINDVGCKRLVLDSLSIFRYLISDQFELRNLIYTLRNILRKKGITSLIILEETDNNSFEHYIFDGVLKLERTVLVEDIPQRTLEILKMRGTNFFQGKHVYRLKHMGIHLVPSNPNIKNILNSNVEIIPTNVKEIDLLLGGGIPKGEVFLLDVDSKSNYKYFILSLLVGQLKIGNKVFVHLPDDITIDALNKFFNQSGLNLYSLIKKQDMLIIDPYNLITDKELDPFIIKVNKLTNEEFSNYIQNDVFNILQKRKNKGEQWLIVYDMNASLHIRGEKYIQNILPVVTALTRSLDFSSIRILNTKEASSITSEQIKRKSTGIIKIWSDNKYQYIKVDKSPTGVSSHPKIMEATDKDPYFKFI